MAETMGWIEASSAMAFLKQSLFPGAETGEAPVQYTEYYKSISAETGRVERVERRLVQDIFTARTHLSELNSLAESFLTTQAEIVRADVSDFESALVSARSARRSFKSAQEILQKRQPLNTDKALAAVELFDVEIELAKTLADSLVAEWQGETNITS